MQIRLRLPMRSPAKPKNGEIKVPRNCSEPNSASASTEPVATSTNQPRITPSISKAQEASRSAGHWKRKLRTSNGASTETRATVTVLFVSSAQSAAMYEPVQRTPAHGDMAASAGLGAESRLTTHKG